MAHATPARLLVQADRTLVRTAGGTRRHLRAEVVAPRRPPRRPVNLALVLDHSGSMHGDKLNLAREGAMRAVRSLGDQDRLSVVVYNERAVVVVPSRVADAEAREHAETMLRRISARGDTDLCGGWLAGCEQVAMELDSSRLGRCLLLTDGLANRGVTDQETIVQHAAGLRTDGVTTSALGLGRGFDESLLRRMAEDGGGNFYFAEHAGQLSDLIAGETGEALNVAAREAELVVLAPAGASVTSPNPFRVRSENGRTVFGLGSLVADQVLSLVLTVELPGGEEGAEVRLECGLQDPDGILDGTTAEAVFTYANLEAYDAQPRDDDVEREVASAYAARARRRAAELGRVGAPDEGKAVLEKTAARIEGYAEDRAPLLELVASLREEAALFADLDDLDYKRIEYSTFRGLRSRGADGMTIGTGRFLFDETDRVLSSPATLAGAKSPFFIAVVTPDGEATELAKAAGQVLTDANPGAFAYAVVDGGTRILDPGRESSLLRDDELGLAYALGASGDAVKIALVRGRLRHRHLLHWYPAERVAIVSLAGWDEPETARAFVAFQMALQSTRHRRPEWDPGAVQHADARGCWGDACESREETRAMLAAGDLCAECRRVYEAAGVDVTTFLHFVGAVRDLAPRFPD